MSSSIGVVPTRRFAATFAIALALCFWGTYATAQAAMQPVDEISAGYSWFHPGGHYNFGLPAKDSASGVDAENVFYLPQAHNLGVLVDGSYNWGSNYGPGSRS